MWLTWPPSARTAAAHLRGRVSGTPECVLGSGVATCVFRQDGNCVPGAAQCEATIDRLPVQVNSVDEYYVPPTFRPLPEAAAGPR